MGAVSLLGLPLAARLTAPSGDELGAQPVPATAG